ncbi:MAG: caspase family protein [Pseudomonadota bacterium]
MLRSLLACALVLFSSFPGLAERRLAMVIGNGAYEHAAPLINPANDASDIAVALREAGFDVILGLDLGKVALEQKLREFSKRIDQADVALLFYAGHGLQVSGRNYLVPVDARLANERDLDFEAVRLEFILAQMELGREGKTSLVFLDACRDNPLARNLARSMGTRSAALGRGLAQMKSGVGTFISFSTQPGNVAVDGKGRNSPFTAALARHIRARGVTLNGTMIRVRRDVIKTTRGKQVPWDHSALTGEFYFHPPEAGATGSAGTPAPKDAVSGTGNVAALARRLKELEATLKRREQDAATTRDSQKADLEYRIRDLERAQRADQRKVFDIMRKFSSVRDARERAEISRNRHQLSVGMIQRGREIKRLRAELAALSGADDRAAKSTEGAVPSGATKSGSSCPRLPPNASDPVALKVGSRVCSATGTEFARVVRIVDRAIAFSVNGGREFTCRAGETCQFDWRKSESPYFTIRAQSDAVRGIEPSGALVPR